MYQLKTRDISKSAIWNDFIRPVMYPFCLIGFFFLAIYIGSNYYYNNISVGLEKLSKKDEKEFTKETKKIIHKIDITYYVNITSTIVQLINQIILFAGIIIYSFFYVKFIEYSYHFQITLMGILFGLGSFLAFAIPTFEVSTIEEKYLQYVENNLRGFFFSKVTPIAVIISYALIYSTNNVKGYKHLGVSGWHRTSMMILLTFLISRNIYYLYYAFKRLKYYHRIRDNLSGARDVIKKIIDVERN